MAFAKVLRLAELVLVKSFPKKVLSQKCWAKTTLLDHCQWFTAEQCARSLLYKANRVDQVVRKCSSWRHVECCKLSTSLQICLEANELNRNSPELVSLRRSRCKTRKPVCTTFQMFWLQVLENSITQESCVLNVPDFRLQRIYSEGRNQVGWTNKYLLLVRHCILIGF